MRAGFFIDQTLDLFKRNAKTHFMSILETRTAAVVHFSGFENSLTGENRRRKDQ